MAKPEPVNIRVERIIEAEPELIYDLVSDVTRMGEWSPETVEAEWLGDATGPAVGATFKGKNKLGPNSWATKPTVTLADRGRTFAFKVPGKSGPTWRYDFERTRGGTRVIEAVIQERRSPLFIRLLQRRAGVTDREDSLRENMTITLDQLAHAAVAQTARA